MSDVIAAGKEIECFCTRCKLVLDHTIIAVLAGQPVKVICKTCHSERKYRPVEKPAAKGKSAAAATPGAKPKTTKPRTTTPVITAHQLEQAWLDMVGVSRRANAVERPFSLATTFKKDEIIQHSKFGDGVVKTIDGNKMTVVFKDGERVMAHGRLA